jgi:Alcohol dehydrogenase GroES-associated
MKAITLHGTGDVRVESVADPSVVDPTDACRACPRGWCWATSSWAWWRRQGPE